MQTYFTPSTISSPSKTVFRIAEVRTILNVHCGCGASFHSVEDAENHARSNAHTLHITGEVRAIKQ